MVQKTSIVMANQPKSMHQIRQLLEHLQRGASVSKIGRLMHMSRNTVRDYRDKFVLTGMSYERLLDCHDAELLLLIKQRPPSLPDLNEKRLKDITPLLPYFQAELRKTGVTKQLLWQEYLRDFPDGYRYTRFCHFLSEAEKQGDAVMRMLHMPGEILEVDFAGDKLHYVDRETGEMVACEVLVCAMPYSHFMHAVALPSQRQEDFISGLAKAMQYLGAVPHAVKCDNLKSAVLRPDRYTPEFTEAMEYFAAHYGTTAMAARVAKPRDKARVESAVNICYLRIYAPLRHRTFYSLAELNHAVAQQLEIHNNQLLQGKEYSRRQRYMQDELPQMKALPPEAYSIRRSTWSKVNKGYHVIIGEDHHSYSVPYRYMGKRLKIIYTTDEVEVYDDQQRVALHKRSYRKYGYTTVKEHMPANHQAMLDIRGYNGTDFREEAKSIGIAAEKVVASMISRAHYVQHTYALWQAFKRMKRNYGASRLEAACQRLCHLEQVTCSALENVLKNGLDKQADQPQPGMQLYTTHENIRGPQAYANQ